MGAGVHPLIRESLDFRRQAAEAELALARSRVEAYEQRHSLTSGEFKRKFESGELGDDREWFDWMAELEVERTLSGKVEALRRLP